MADELVPKARSGWATGAAAAATLCVVVVLLLSVGAFLAEPGDEPVALLAAAGILAAATAVLCHVAQSRFRRVFGRRSRRLMIAVAAGYVGLAVAAAAAAYPRSRLTIATWRTPPNYELTLELRSVGEPVTGADVDEFKERLSLRLTRLIVPHEFRPTESPRVILRLRVPEGADMTRPFNSPLLTINLVHDQTDAILARSGESPAGWTVVDHGDTRYIVKTDPLVVNDVRDAKVVPHNERYAVAVSFGPTSADRMGHALRQYQGRRAAVLLDGEMFAVVRLEGGVPAHGEYLVAGNLQLAEANETAMAMRSGLTAARVHVVAGRHIR